MTAALTNGTFAMIAVCVMVTIRTLRQAAHIRYARRNPGTRFAALMGENSRRVGIYQLSGASKRIGGYYRLFLPHMRARRMAIRLNQASGAQPA